MLGRTLRGSTVLVEEDSILPGTTSAVNQALPEITLPNNLRPDGFALESATRHGRKLLLVVARNERGVLYGVFDLLRRLSFHGSFPSLEEVSNPAAPVRWISQWDNLDRSIERGYAGRSVFFLNQHVSQDLTRAGDYARLLASIGINGCTVNNVNASSRMLAPESGRSDRSALASGGRSRFESAEWRYGYPPARHRYCAASRRSSADHWNARSRRRGCA